MQVEQISIFLENKTGSLDGAIKLVAEAGVSIRALSLADTTDFGILRLIVSDVAAAKDALKLPQSGNRGRKLPALLGGTHILDAATGGAKYGREKKV